MRVTTLDAEPGYLTEVLRLAEAEWGPSSLAQIRNSIGYWDVCFVAVFADKVIGFALLAVHDGIPNAYNLLPWLTKLYTAQDYRGLGVASKCIEAVINEARTRGFHDLYLWYGSERERLGLAFENRAFKVLWTEGGIAATQPLAFDADQLGPALTVMKLSLGAP